MGVEAESLHQNQLQDFLICVLFERWRHGKDKEIPFAGHSPNVQQLGLAQA